VLFSLPRAAGDVPSVEARRGQYPLTRSQKAKCQLKGVVMPASFSVLHIKGQLVVGIMRDMTETDGVDNGVDGVVYRWLERRVELGEVEAGRKI
jgi:hypothetical protein